MMYEDFTMIEKVNCAIPFLKVIAEVKEGQGITQSYSGEPQVTGKSDWAEGVRNFFSAVLGPLSPGQGTVNAGFRKVEEWTARQPSPEETDQKKSPEYTVLWSVHREIKDLIAQGETCQEALEKAVNNCDTKADWDSLIEEAKSQSITLKSCATAIKTAEEGINRICRRATTDEVTQQADKIKLTDRKRLENLSKSLDSLAETGLNSLSVPHDLFIKGERITTTAMTERLSEKLGDALQRQLKNDLPRTVKLVIDGEDVDLSVKIDSQIEANGTEEAKSGAVSKKLDNLYEAVKDRLEDLFSSADQLEGKMVYLQADYSGDLLGLINSSLPDEHMPFAGASLVGNSHAKATIPKLRENSDQMQLTKLEISKDADSNVLVTRTQWYGFRKSGMDADGTIKGVAKGIITTNLSDPDAAVQVSSKIFWASDMEPR